MALCPLLQQQEWRTPARERKAMQRPGNGTCMDRSVAYTKVYPAFLSCQADLRACKDVLACELPDTAAAGCHLGAPACMSVAMLHTCLLTCHNV